MTIPQRRAVTHEIDSELKRLGFKPTEIEIKGRLFIAVLAENIRLKGSIATLIAGLGESKVRAVRSLEITPGPKKLSKRGNKKAAR